MILHSIDDTLELLNLLRRDLSTVDLETAIGIYHQPSGTWIDGPVVIQPLNYDGEYVVTLPGRMQSIESLSDGRPSFVSIMNAVQDWVIDETGRGWPELHATNGDFVDILIPNMSKFGTPVWACNKVEIPLGSLANRPDTNSPDSVSK